MKSGQNANKQATMLILCHCSLFCGHNGKIVTIIVATMAENKHCDLIYGHNSKVAEFSTLKMTMIPLGIRSKKKLLLSALLHKKFLDAKFCWT